MQHLDNGAGPVRRSDLITDEAVKRYRLRLFPKGTILVPKSGASIRLEKRGLLSEDSYVVSHLATIVSHPELVDNDYLFFNLASMRLSAEKADGYPTLGIGEIRDTPILLPPIEEQRAIAGVLRAIQLAKAATESVIAATRDLKRSLTWHLFSYGHVPIAHAENVATKETEIGAVPEHWTVRPLGDLAQLIQYGTSERCESASPGIPVLGIPSVVTGRVKREAVKYLRSSAKKTENLALVQDDLLFVRTNATRANVGRCAIYTGDPEGALFASYLLRLRLKDEAQLLPKFLFRFAWSHSGEASLSGRASGAADGKFNINSKTLRDVIVPIPSIPEQEAIVKTLEAIDAKIDREVTSRHALAQFFDALLVLLMTGRRRLALGETT